MSDGAAATVIMSDARAKALGLKPLGRFVALRDGGMPAGRVRHRPVFAIPKALKLAGLKLEDIAVIELNEAFAAQSLAVIQQAGLDLAKVNPNGGAIALGHPLGCTGAKLTATILRDLQRKNARYGMVTMCIGGGMGAAGQFLDSCQELPRGTHPAADAHRHHAVPRIFALQSRKIVAVNFAPVASERMAERDRAAVRIHFR